MFLLTADYPTKAINSREIVWLREHTEELRPGFKRPVTTAILEDGSHVRMIETIEKIERATQPVIKASDGFELLRLLPADEHNPTDVVLRFPIVAWRCDGARAIPIAIGDEYDDESYPPKTAIRLPDGRIDVPEDTQYDDEAQWVENYKKQAVAWEASRSAIAQKRSVSDEPIANESERK